MRSLLNTVALCAIVLPMSVNAAEYQVEQTEDRIDIKVKGKLFTSYRFKGFNKPILYPVNGPDNTSMTRHYPQKKDVEGEAKDHPHHQSIWFTYDKVNGQNFWHMGKARILAAKRPIVNATQNNEHISVEINASNNWTADDAKTVVCTDTTQIICHVLPDGTRMIDYTVTMHASHGDINFGDSKEGVMGVRTNPALRLKPVKKGGKPTGQSVNSEGVEGKAMWGKKAAWVSYWGPIDKGTYGISIFDHPTNLRHPTTWHARDYGLVAANPFGLSHFMKGKGVKGDHTIKSGNSQRFKYRIVLHRGDAKSAKVADQFASWVKSK